MGIVVRIPRDMYKEILEFQRRYRENGIDISFSQAAKMWYKNMKKFDTVPKKWRFPEFS